MARIGTFVAGMSPPESHARGRFCMGGLWIHTKRELRFPASKMGECVPFRRAKCYPRTHEGMCVTVKACSLGLPFIPITMIAESVKASINGQSVHITEYYGKC